MRHGAGPFSSHRDKKNEAVQILSADLDTLDLVDGDERQRLGCYFCNDVVAPVDVISNLQYLIY